MTFGERVDQFLQVSTLTQAELAEILGVSRATVNAWACGRSTPFGLVGRVTLELFERWETDSAFREAELRRIGR